MEAFTAFVEGPLCFVIVYAMVKQKPWRYTLQLLVSFGQLYGDVLYFATTYLEGI
jgi:cholestenol delta-isomerase